MWIAAVRHRLRQQPAHTDITLRLPQQQCTAIGRLIAAFEIDGEFLAANGGRSNGSGVSSVKPAVAQGRYARQLLETPVCYVNRGLFATAVSEIHMLVPNRG
jgi:hypothetical protein